MEDRMIDRYTCTVSLPKAYWSCRVSTTEPPYSYILLALHRVGQLALLYKSLWTFELTDLKNLFKNVISTIHLTSNASCMHSF